MSKEITQETIGKLLVGQHERDAIHIAVLPVICGAQYLCAGEHIKLQLGTIETAIRAQEPADSHGIVDPFITDTIYRGQQFWMFVTPNTVTGLKHVWDHPMLKAASNVQRVMGSPELWLRQFAERWNFDYDEMIRTASSMSESDGEWDNYITAQGVDLHSRGELGEDYDLFWMNLESMTGRSYSQPYREKLGWSCSC
jgi:hypothetical protein